jgi:hypothetical protein
MGFFLKALAAIVIGDAIDRHTRRPPKYWYPNQPGRAPARSHTADAAGEQRAGPGQRRWNPEYPERP